MKANLQLMTFCSAIAAFVVPTVATSSTVSIHAGDPQRPGVVSTTWRDSAGDTLLHVDMPVDGAMTATDMAAVTANHLRHAPLLDPSSVSLDGEMVHVNLGSLDDSFVYTMDWGTGTSAQDSMKLLLPEIGQGTIAAAGHFQPFLQPGEPAIFTAGIVTDVGELAAQVSAAELNFQTDGPIICQALFQRLAPRAPQYGAQINYAGDRLEVYFDPAYTVTQGGIIFGTTSPSQGFSGTVTSLVEPNDPPVDNNGDGIIDTADYVALRKGVSDPYSEDTYRNWGTHFGERVGIGAVASVAVPEPATLGLLIMAAACMLLPGRRFAGYQKHVKSN
jgi:hypothetical protein